MYFFSINGLYVYAKKKIPPQKQGDNRLLIKEKTQSSYSSNPRKTSPRNEAKDFARTRTTNTAHNSQASKRPSQKA